MSKKVKKIKINSIVINKEFLEKIGKILEREVEERENKFKKSIEGKNKHALQICILRKDKCKVNYTIVSDEEELEFSSMKELLSTSVFPQKIKSISFRISHFNPNYVDISFTLDNDYDSIAKLYLSSEDEAKILKIEKDIKNLFIEYRSKYGWIFKIPGSKSFMLQALTLLFTVFGTRAILKIENFLFPSLTKEALNNSIWVIVIVLLVLFYNLFKYLYPYYLFEMSSRNNFRSSIKFASYIIFLSIISSAIYEIIKFLI